jgi:hypothetical protein
MAEYKNIPLEIGRERRCCYCNAELEGNDSPWSVCWNPAQGGFYTTADLEPRGLLCQRCAEKILLSQIVEGR